MGADGDVLVVVDTTKVRFFKQITTKVRKYREEVELLLTPQRYDFSSKSQLTSLLLTSLNSCCWHHKGTIFQANHNDDDILSIIPSVVVDTTKVRFFKQITTFDKAEQLSRMLLLTPQRYDFSSKSQRIGIGRTLPACCCWHHKGTIFQANHNRLSCRLCVV